ncbi:MAG TPA: nitroreductase family deazaflavin-dependent oxidoreductase [Jatrophihabitantaceae bacterium]
MGLADDLGYVYPRPTVVHRGVQAFAATRGGAWLFAKTLPPADRVVSTASKGRVTVPAIMARLPVLDLTTTGRKSGQPRHTHLIAVPFGDTLALIGTNFGQANTPAWVFNLEAEPRARVTYRDEARDVVARPATEPERADIFATAASVYVGYAKYRQRISGRTVRVFVLDPA